MPKKTRKMKQRAAMRRAVQVTEAPEVQVRESLATKEEGPVRMRPSYTPSRTATSPLNFDYSHIYGDLRRIAIYAGFFFAVLVVLSFVIK